MHFVQRGGWVVLVTLTMRHWQNHGLQQCADALSTAWQAVNSGKVWQADKELSGYAGYCRALEVTRSAENGWHTHVHAVVVFNSRPTDEMLDKITDGMFRRWSNGLEKAGMPRPDRAVGLDVQHPKEGAAGNFESLRAWAQYVTKGIAGEAVLGAGKEAKGRSRSVRQLMRDALIPQVWQNETTGEMVETLDLEAQGLLAEYERVMRGRRQLTWSTGRHDLRKAASLEEERTDEEIAQDDLEGEDVAVIPSASWRAVEPRAAELLSVTEREGVQGARDWLDRLGVEWWRPTGLTDHRRRGEGPGC